MNPLIRAAYKRLGIIHLGRRRVRDIVDFLADRKIDTVIDVGANIGQFGQGLRAEGYRGKIVSFEPVASVYQELAKKAASDGYWDAHRCGLGAATGAAQINVSELTVFSSILDMSSTASLHDSRTAVTRTEEIEIRTLDDVTADLTGNIFLKIDAQGYERHVIEGGRQTIGRVLGIQLELPVIRVYEGEWQFHEALKFMSDLGFVPAQIQPVNYHGADNVSAVDFDCLFRPVGPLDGAPSSG
ncbi:MAG TPA: FkbM family methyltransferase [Nitrospira sp.]|nr:FkbM family methyltransferase [Nitrospira sp.]